MKTILVLRHGKSSWESGSDSDHDRPLAERGREAAGIVGSLLARTGQVPDRVLSSSAVRALETVELAAEAGKWSCPIKVVPDFYGASTEAVLARVREEDDDASSLLLAGHEPTWSALVSELVAGGSLRFPTAALARVDLPIDGWRELQSGRGALVWFLIPRLVKAMGFEAKGAGYSKRKR